MSIIDLVNIFVGWQGYNKGDLAKPCTEKLFFSDRRAKIETGKVRLLIDCALVVLKGFADAACLGVPLSLYDWAWKMNHWAKQELARR